VNDPTRLEHAEQLLEERGRRIGPVRIAAGRSGLALSFPDEPMLHLSWIALAVAAGLIVAVRKARAT
jgi:hypothetical protein